jgi:hypothetical protein
MYDFLVDNKYLYQIELNTLRVISFIVYVSTIFYLFGFLDSTKFLYLNYIIKILIAFFLMYRFNGFRKDKVSFTDLDRKVCFSAGVYILAVSFQEYIIFFSKEFRSFMEKNNFLLKFKV